MTASSTPNQLQTELDIRHAEARRSGPKAWMLAVLLFLFVLPLMGGTYWMYLQSKEEIASAELQSDLLQARTLSAVVERDLTSAGNILTSIVDRPLVRNEWARHDLVSVKADLQEARKLEPAFLFVSVYDVDGTLRLIEPNDKIVGDNFSYRDWYRGLTAHWQPYVSEVYRTAAAPNPLVVAVAVPIRDSNGKPTGIAMGTYSLAALARKFSAIEKGATADYYVVDQHGVVAAARNVDAQSAPVKASASTVVSQALAGAEGGEQLRIGNENTFVAFAPAPRLGWAVLYSRPESVALAPALHLKSQNRSVSLYLLLVYLVTAALAAFLVKRQTHLLSANQALNAELEERVGELKLAGEHLARAKEEAERSNKFKDQFLSTMSHELRTPLNAVLGFSDLLNEERYGPLNDRQRRYVNHIHTGGKHLLRLINDILDLSKIEAGRLQLAIESVSVNTCFAESLDTLRPLADKKSQTLVERTSPNLSVRADMTRFKQILMNLIGNAIKFTPERGTIEIGAEKLGDAVRVEVRDSGPGIPIEEQQRIFEAFHRLQQSATMAEGTGLGLAITKSLVELHGGQLGIESAPGSGSTFYFTLPAAPEVKAEESRETLPSLRQGESPRILVVEDDPAAAHLIQSQLVSAGADVVLCDSPTSVLETAAKLQPAAITMDVIMKPINGWELLASLKSDPRTANIPVIVVTIVDQPSTGALLGADEFIVKPVERGTLLTAVERCMNRRGRARQAQPILVVEDDPPTREFIAELLRKNGFVVRTAEDAAQARATVAESLPELVILDLILPATSGLQLLSEWRSNSRTADLPVFVLTSKDLTQAEKDYIRANAGALLHKKERWQESLLLQLQRALAPVPLERS